LETERLALEVAALTGDSKTGAVRQALRERRDRIRCETSALPTAQASFLETELRLRFLPPRDDAPR
jgi:antitoxin VapB